MDTNNIENLRSRARLLLRESEGGEYLDTGDALDILRELAGVDERDPCPMPDCDGRIEDGVCAECDTDEDAMTLQTFRAGARRVEWCDAVRECEEAEQTFEDYDDKPDAVWIYPGGVWLAELHTREFELHLERDDMRSLDRDQLDRTLHAWAVRECNLHEPIEVPKCPGCERPAHASETDDDGYHEGCRPRSDADVVDEIGGF